MSRLLEIVLGNAGSAALLAVAVALACRWIRQPAVRHVLWVLVLLRLLAPPIIELGLLPPPPAPSILPAPVVTSPILAPAEPTSDMGFRVTIHHVGALLWLGGVLLVVAVMVVRTVRFQRGISASHEVGRPDLQPRLEGLCAQLGISRTPPIKLVPATVPPLLWGRLAAPCLVVPTPLLDTLDETEQDALLAHELAHLKRRDHWVRRLETLAVILFWWHPVVWWARRRIRVVEELCCDALVIRQLPHHARAYATCLVKTARYLSTTQPASFGATAMASLPELKGRITMIMTHTPNNRLSLVVRAAVLVTVAAVLLISPTLSARTGTDQLYAGEPISLSLLDATLQDVVSTFAEVANVTIAISPQAAASGVLESRVTVDVSSQPWDRAFDDLLRARDLVWTRVGDVIWVHGAWESLDGDRSFTGKPIRLQLDGADLHDVLRMMSQLTGFEIVADPTLDVAVTIDVNEMPWDQALDMICRVNGLTYTVEGGTILVTRLTSESGVILRSPTTPEPIPPPDLDFLTEIKGETVYRFNVNGPITPPARVESPPPEYPQEARDARIQGVVVLEVVIDSAGSIADIKVIRGLPLGVTEAAIEAVRQWRFEPARLNDEPVAVQYVLTVRFRLDETPAPAARNTESEQA